MSLSNKDMEICKYLETHWTIVSANRVVPNINPCNDWSSISWIQNFIRLQEKHFVRLTQQHKSSHKCVRRKQEQVDILVNKILAWEHIIL